MPTLGLKLSPDAWLYRVASGAPYVPNYPPGLSGISGLVGWYDSSASSTVVVDGSNNVTRWKNYWNGATQGATVLPDFVPPSESNYATKVTGQSYIYGQSSGSHVGISFDGTASEMQLENNIPSSLALNNLTYFIVVKMPQLNTGCVIDIVDSATNNDVSFEPTYNGSNLISLSWNATSNGNSINTGVGSQTYVSLASLSGTNLKAAFISSGNLNYYNSQSLQVNATPVGIGSTNLPWAQITLGSDYLNSSGGLYGNALCLIGEILVYNNLPNQANAATIAEYLRAKWA